MVSLAVPPKPTGPKWRSLINNEADNRTALLDTVRALSLCIQSDSRKLWDEIYATYPALRGKENYVKRDGGKMFICTMADDEDSAIVPMQTIQVG